MIRSLFIVFAFLISSQVCLIQKANADKPVPKTTEKPLTSTTSGVNIYADTIISIQELSTKGDTARMDQIISIKIKTRSSPDAFQHLMIDCISIPGAFYKKSILCNEAVIQFRVNDKVHFLLKEYLRDKPFEKMVIPVKISVYNIETGRCAFNGSSQQDFYLELKHKIKNTWIWVIILSLLIGTLIYLSLTKNILKEDENIYFSLGRTQLFFWTVLIVICYLYIWFVKEEFPDLNASILIILGISVSTTTASKIIENDNKDKVETKKGESKGFLVDILSDASGISVHRFQNVLFNLVFGAIFFQKSFSTCVFPEFDSNVLILMGISSSAYAALKITEKKKDEIPTPTPPPTSDAP